MKNLTKPLKNKMANRFRKIREVLGLTQKELAQKIGRKVQAITDIEIQRTLPTIPLLVDIYTKFNIPFNWLILGEGEMFIKKKPGLESAPPLLKDSPASNCRCFVSRDRTRFPGGQFPSRCPGTFHNISSL